MPRAKKIDESEQLDDAEIQELSAWLVEVRDDPYGFVLGAFPWGMEGTELAKHDGPDEWQGEVLKSIRDGLLTVNQAVRLARASGHGIGKAQPHDTVIDTPAGPRRFGDLGIGDLVFTATGEPTRIIGIHERGVRPIYRVAFDDRSSTLVCEDHLWNVRGRQNRRYKNRTDLFGNWETVSTKELLRRGAKRSNGASKARQWEIPRQGSVSYPYRWVPIDAYALGCWLGNGTRGLPAITSADDEVRARIAAAGYKVSSKRKYTRSPATYTLHVYPDMGRWLRMLGIQHCYSYTKFVPEIYKYNLPEIRADVLRGLLDTDGFVSNEGTIIFSSSSQQLTKDVVWLARSLGGKAILHNTAARKKFTRSDGVKVEGRPAYIANIRMPLGFNPVYIQRKKDRVKPTAESRYMSRWIDSIEYMGDMDCRCITVEHPSGLYLTNDFIVTHNSALLGWIIIWAMATVVDTRIVVTANTEVQLRTKTWPELGRWARLSRVRSMFTFMATALYSANKEYEKTWRADAITWSEARPEAFAGLHNQGKRIVVIFDEASWIPDIIWETTEGALTDKDTQIIWCAFGNPTRNTGRFKECFGRFRDRWNHQQIDSRTVRITNKDQIRRWQADYGEDSDFFRVRVRGMFPRVSSMQFIPTQLVEEAMKDDRRAEVTFMDPLVIGVDVARYGDNASVICFRRGRDARSIPWIVLQGVNTMTLAGRVAQLALEMKPDAIFVDEGGVGGGVVDRLQMLHIPCIPVNFGAHADYAVPNAEGRITYRNKSTEMWGAMRTWMAGAMLPNDPELLDELISREYGYTTIDGKDAIVLESKQDMRTRNVPSPDRADALALTFAFPIGLSDHRAQLTGKPTHQFEYDPMAQAFQAR